MSTQKTERLASPPTSRQVLQGSGQFGQEFKTFLAPALKVQCGSGADPSFRDKGQKAVPCLFGCRFLINTPSPVTRGSYYCSEVKVRYFHTDFGCLKGTPGDQREPIHFAEVTQSPAVRHPWSQNRLPPYLGWQEAFLPDESNEFSLKFEPVMRSPLASKTDTARRNWAQCGLWRLGGIPQY